MKLHHRSAREEEMRCGCEGQTRLLRMSMRAALKPDSSYYGSAHRSHINSSHRCGARRHDCDLVQTHRRTEIPYVRKRSLQTTTPMTWLQQAMTPFRCDNLAMSGLRGFLCNGCGPRLCARRAPPLLLVAVLCNSCPLQLMCRGVVSISCRNFSSLIRVS